MLREVDGVEEEICLLGIEIKVVEECRVLLSTVIFFYKISSGHIDLRS